MNVIGLIEYIIVALMVISAILAVEWRDLLAAAVGMAAVSLFASILFFMLQAPDVAMTEAAIGAALSGAIVIFAVKRTQRFETEEEEKPGWWVRW
ncbi:MAG: energy-converting hydrogenase subunit [Thermococcaceae archaeon]|nr:energy-converting hydrogenase subunit [Thermococcaceae archaeon]MDK2914644.1 energy-converting hydrogenase subunit [Thermococcaceae archaeon]